MIIIINKGVYLESTYSLRGLGVEEKFVKPVRYTEQIYFMLHRIISK